MGNALFDNIEQVPGIPKSEDEFVFVSIPIEDLYDNRHPGVQLNQHRFEPGNTYKVPAAVGAEIEDRLVKFNKEQVRLLRPKVDSKSINQVNAGSAWTRGGGGIVSSNEAQMASLGADDKVITIKW